MSDWSSLPMRSAKEFLSAKSQTPTANAAPPATYKWTNNLNVNKLIYLQKFKNYYYIKIWS